ncbi:MAG TPA: hypothetical protein QF626_02495 [Prochlorococcaceae cyanobacterium Fu_MAG_50]|nr:hypothetical protein [Prochlorococcaceae cyanobacterium Fu_MAG_50]
MDSTIRLGSHRAQHEDAATAAQPPICSALHLFPLRPQPWRRDLGFMAAKCIKTSSGH